MKTKSIKFNVIDFKDPSSFPRKSPLNSPNPEIAFETIGVCVLTYDDEAGFLGMTGHFKFYKDGRITLSVHRLFLGGEEEADVSGYDAVYWCD